MPPLELAQLIAAADELKSAIDSTVTSFANHEDFGNEFDQLTPKAKRFASLVLADRIRELMNGKFADDFGAVPESLQHKTETAQRIRSWLGEWNLGFVNPARPDERYQIYTDDNGSPNGIYRLKAYGKSQINNRITRYLDVKRIVESPVLDNIIDSHARGDKRVR